MGLLCNMPREKNTLKNGFVLIINTIIHHSFNNLMAVINLIDMGIIHKTGSILISLFLLLFSFVVPIESNGCERVIPFMLLCIQIKFYLNTRQGDLSLNFRIYEQWIHLILNIVHSLSMHS